MLFTFTANAQLIHVDGSKAVGLNFGYAPSSFNISTRLSLYKNSNLILRGSLEVESVSFKLSKANVLTASPEVMYTLKSFGEKVFLSAKCGLSTGVELLSNSTLAMKKSQFIVGESMGLCAEYYVSQRIMFNLDIDQRFYQLSKLGNASFITKLGINYNF